MKKIAPVFLALAALSPLSAAVADVTIQESVRVDGKGLMSMASMSIDSTTYIAGNKARIDSNVSNTSGLVRMFGGAGPSGQIVRLDQDALYELNIKKKRYRQVSLAQQREEMRKAMESGRDAQAAQSQAMMGMDDSQCEWSEPRADVQRTGEKATIAGLPTERLKITATQSCTDRKANTTCDFALMLDQWLTPQFAAADETMAYQRAYAEKMGIALTGSGNFSQRAEQSFGQYKGIWEEISRKMKDVGGYPLKATFALGFGGPQCTHTATAQQNAGGAGMANPLGQLGGLFGAKKKQEAAPPAPEVQMGNGLVPMMVVSSEMKSFSREPVNASVFEVPAGFKPEK